jgi:hypothetical protein
MSQGDNNLPRKAAPNISERCDPQTRWPDQRVLTLDFLIEFIYKITQFIRILILPELFICLSPYFELALLFLKNRFTLIQNAMRIVMETD